MPDTGSRGPDPWQCVQGTEATIYSEQGGRLQLGRATVLDQTKIILGRAIGVVDRPSLSEAMRLIVGDARFGARLPTLWDLRLHDFDHTPVVQFRSYAFLLSEFPQRAGVRRGYLVATETGYGMMRMFQQLASGHGLEDESKMRVSTDPERLVRWLAPGKVKAHGEAKT